VEWIGATPIFDTRTSMWHNRLTKVINPFDEIESKPFYEKQSKEIVSIFSAKTIELKTLNSKSRINFQK
jgi:hypothetical protein